MKFKKYNTIGSKDLIAASNVIKSGELSDSRISGNGF